MNPISEFWNQPILNSEFQDLEPLKKFEIKNVLIISVSCSRDWSFFTSRFRGLPLEMQEFQDVYPLPLSLQLRTCSLYHDYTGQLNAHISYGFKYILNLSSNTLSLSVSSNSSNTAGLIVFIFQENICPMFLSTFHDLELKVKIAMRVKLANLEIIKGIQFIFGGLCPLGSANTWHILDFLVTLRSRPRSH